MTQSNRKRLSRIEMRGMTVPITVILLCLAQNIYGVKRETGSFWFEQYFRTYEVYLPDGYSENAKAPLLFFLHNEVLIGQKSMEYTRLTQVADTAGFVIVCPFAVGIFFNCGLIDNPTYFRAVTDANDLGFIDALIDTLDNNYGIDLQRVYVCGFGEGAVMIYKLGCQLSDRIAAIAAVGGILTKSTANDFCPVKRMPVLEIHGTDDPWIPMNGPKGFLSLDQTLRYWTSFNNCVQSDTTSLPDSDPNDKSTVEKIQFKDDTGNYPVIYYKVSNGGPSWPGANLEFDFDWSGNTNQDMNASEVIWNFFKQFENTEPTYPAFAQSQENYPGYINPQGDTLTINAHLINPENHPAVVNALIQGSESAYRDSVELFDDGLHRDGDAADNLWGGEIGLSGLQEGWYQVNITTRDLTTGTVHHAPFESNFTTIGPVVFHSLSFRNADDVLEPGASIRLYVTLKNNGKTLAATDLEAQLFCLEPSWVNMITDTKTYRDIAPGETMQNSSSYQINILDTYPGNTAIPMEIHVTSNDQLFWIDTFSIPVTVGVETEEEMEPKQFALYPNHPNPFNPSTTIRYSIPKSSQVILTIYDLIGREITTLVNEAQASGEYSVIWNGQDHPSGIYLCRLMAGNFTETRKLLLQK